jgi:CRP-like cAMP-binding protein
MSKQNLTCANCEIRQHTLFSRLPESLISGLDFIPRVSRHAPQDVLFQQSSKSDILYTIRKGFVKLESRLEDGSRRIVRLLSHGDTLGLQAWQLGEHPHQAVALTEVELCHIPYSDLENLQRQSHALNQELFSRLCNESLQADMWITQFSTGSVTRRMAYLLLYLLEMQQRSGNDQLQLMGRDDMAAILGVRQESISRTITQFKQEGLLSPVRRDTYLVDESALLHKVR